MKTAITHPGAAHRDEFMALCLLIAAGKISKILRRDPTPAELEDPNIYVVDVGLRHEPSKLNFDHHQFDRDHAPTCAITLVLEHLGIDLVQARSIWGWLEFSEKMDSKGPFATAAQLGMTPDALFETVSPIETTVLRWFESTTVVDSQEWWGYGSGQGVDEGRLWHLMRMVGEEKLNYLNEVVERLAFLRSNAKVTSIDGLTVVDATCVDRKNNPTLGLEMFCQEWSEVAVTVTQDDRGEGKCLFRRKDHPQVDFSRLEGEVLFAHKGGFVAKTHPGQAWEPLVAKAIRTS